MSSEIVRQIKVHAPCINSQLNLQFPSSIFMHDIIREIESQVVQHPDYLLGTPLEEFSLFETDDKTILNSLPPVVPTFNLFSYPQDQFTYERAITTIKIKFEDNSEKRMSFGSHITVAKLIETLKHDKNLSCEGEYEIGLLAATSKRSTCKNSIRMNPHRTLRSYRLKENDILMFHIAMNDSTIWQNSSQGNSVNQLVGVIITIPEPFNLSKAMKISNESTMDELKSLFIRKMYLSIPQQIYGLFLGEEYIEDKKKINSLPISNPIRLTCKLKEKKAEKLFGVDPESLPMVIDQENGIEIPEVLLILKQLLLVNSGLSVEGLFRRSGSESEMKKLKTLLEEGGDVSTKDVHSVATLIKRWFKELPSRILVNQSIVLSDLVHNPSDKLNLFLFLSPLYSRLLYWLFNLCLIIIQNCSTSKMDPKNLAIVWGPAIVQEPAAATMADNPYGNLDLAITGYGVDIVESNLRYYRENNVINPIVLTSVPLVSKKPSKIALSLPLNESTGPTGIRRTSSEKLQKLVNPSSPTPKPIATSLGWTKAIPKHESAVSPRFPTPQPQNTFPSSTSQLASSTDNIVKTNSSVSKRLKRSGTFTVTNLTEKLSKRSPTLGRKHAN